MILDPKAGNPLMRRTSTIRRALAVTGLALGLLPAAAQADCGTVRLPVALSPGAAETSLAVGQLCRPSQPGARAKTTQLLIHGATYGKTYWDWPQQPYSYVRAALAAGYSTLSVDRLGVGQTSRPASGLVDAAANAFVLHQWIGALRAGTLGGGTSRRVVSVGHSLGSALAVEESTTYHDVDALVLSGFLHSLGPGVDAVVGALYPAAFDPRFAGTISDQGYLTTQPGSRGVFYWLPGADPAVVARDETLKETMSAAEFPGLNEGVYNPPATNPSRNVDVPVLLATGDHDSLFCGGQVSCTSTSEVVANEKPYWPNAPRLDVAIVPLAGHDVNLHRTAPLFFVASQAWIALRAG
jgi:pimeloyl-ACP methyl ester carboxylesterase